MTGIADNGFLLAFANRRDTHFPWAFALAEYIGEPLLTGEAVLAETACHLRNSDVVLRFLETWLVRLAFEIEAHRSELARRYSDRQPHLADLCPIRMIKLSPQLPVITVDGDFRVYRRNRRDAISVIMPPDSVLMT